jgi:protein TilB
MGRVQKNEGSQQYILTDSADGRSVVLEVAVGRYLDTAQIKVDVQPLLVRCLVRGRLLQLHTPEVRTTLPFVSAFEPFVDVPCLSAQARHSADSGTTLIAGSLPGCQRLSALKDDRRSRDHHAQAASAATRTQLVDVSQSCTTQSRRWYWWKYRLAAHRRGCTSSAHDSGGGRHRAARKDDRCVRR